MTKDELNELQAMKKPIWVVMGEGVCKYGSYHSWAIRAFLDKGEAREHMVGCNKGCKAGLTASPYDPKPPIPLCDFDTVSYLIVSVEVGKNGG